jgi:hypothetical protein
MRTIWSGLQGTYGGRDKNGRCLLVLAYFPLAGPSALQPGLGSHERSSMLHHRRGCGTDFIPCPLCRHAIFLLSSSCKIHYPRLRTLQSHLPYTPRSLAILCARSRWPTNMSQSKFFLTKSFFIYSSAIDLLQCIAMVVSSCHIVQVGNGMCLLMCAEDGGISYSRHRATWGWGSSWAGITRQPRIAGRHCQFSYSTIEITHPTSIRRVSLLHSNIMIAYTK